MNDLENEMPRAFSGQRERVFALLGYVYGERFGQISAVVNRILIVKQNGQAHRAGEIGGGYVDRIARFRIQRLIEPAV